MDFEIPEEGYLPFIEGPIAIHWDYHAILMFTIWFLVVPASVMFLRFGKINPSTWGIPRGTSKWAWPELCWTVHKVSLYVAMFFAVASSGIAMMLSGGFSATFHAWFGLGAITLGVLQVVSAWFRGHHGGRKDPGADPEDRASWSGDHFDMTPQRWWFEAFHKTAGYFAVIMALGAVTTGLAQYWMPTIAVGVFIAILVVLVLAVILQGRGHNHDTYNSVFGTHPKHPFNKRRYDRMIDESDMKP